MSLASMMRYDINECFGESDERIAIGDLVELENCYTLVNWGNPHLHTVEHVLKATDSNLSKYKVNHRLTHLVRKRTFNYRYSQPSPIAMMRAEMNKLNHDDGHVILTEDEVWDLLHGKTDKGLTMLNWYHSLVAKRFDASLAQQASKWKHTHYCLIWKDLIRSHGEWRGKRGFDIGRVKGLYKRYSKLLSGSEAMEPEISFF